jgi:hypothetical protein
MMINDVASQATVRTARERDERRYSIHYTIFFVFGTMQFATTPTLSLEGAARLKLVQFLPQNIGKTTLFIRFV